MRKAENRSEAAERIEYFSRAIDAWTPAHTDSLLTNCLFRRGEAYYERYEFPAAIRDLDRALDRDPRNARAFYLRGRIRLHEALLGPTPLKSALLAVKDLAEHSALAPDDIPGLTALGRAQARAGRIADALRSFARAQRLAPRDPGPRLGAARALMAARDWERALGQLDEAERLAGGRIPEIYEERAACLAETGDRAAALAALKRGLPRHEEILEDLARSRAHAAEIAESQYALGQALKLREKIQQAQKALKPAPEPESAGKKPSLITPRQEKKKTAPKKDPGVRIYVH